jgi:hypothetical protein
VSFNFSIADSDDLSFVFFAVIASAEQQRGTRRERESVCVCVCVCVCSRVECRTWVGSKEAVVSDMIVRRAVAAATAASLLVILHRW